jgi:hypothetical protein
MFAVVPEVGIKLGYKIMPSIQLGIGYDFLFISNVLGPTDQIDRNCDLPSMKLDTGLPKSGAQ